MLAPYVAETTTTTGSGNLTLAGAIDSDHQTFNTAFGTDRRFYYYILDTTNNAREHGVGYLSTSTTLVREVVIYSTNSNAVVTLSSGTKTVLCDASNAMSAIGTSVLGGQAYVKSAHWTRESPGGYALAANRLHYVPFLLLKPLLCDGIGCEVTTSAASSTVHLALYDMDGSANPQKKIVGTSTGIDSSTTGVKVETFSTTLIPAGLYWFAHWSDGAVALLANTSQEWTIGTGIGIDASNPEGELTMRFINSQTSLTTLADPATAPDTDNYTVGPVMNFLRGT